MTYDRLKMSGTLDWKQVDQETPGVNGSPAINGKPYGAQPLYFSIAKICFYALILLCSLLGNCMVIFIIACNRRIRTASCLLVMNLAACDFLTPLVGIPFDFAAQQTGYWLYGSFGCKILYPMTTLTSTSSAFILALISLDRYRHIMHPFKSRLTKGQVKVLIVSVYAFSLVIVSPYISVLHLENGVCKENWPLDIYKKLYTFLLFLVQYCLPLLFMIFMYSLALKNLYMVSDRIYLEKIGDREGFMTQSPQLQFKSSSNAHSPWSLRWVSKLSRGAANDANKRATKMFIMIVVVFAIFMFPNQVIWLWAEFRADPTNMAGSNVYTMPFIICSLFTYANGVLNPLIYARMSPEFRRLNWYSLTK